MLLKNIPSTNHRVLKLVGKVQQSFVLCQEDDYDGEFVFLCCRKGLSKSLGRKLAKGERIAFKVILIEDIRPDN